MIFSKISFDFKLKFKSLQNIETFWQRNSNLFSVVLSVIFLKHWLDSVVYQCFVNIYSLRKIQKSKTFAFEVGIRFVFIDCESDLKYIFWTEVNENQ